MREASHSPASPLLCCFSSCFAKQCVAMCSFTVTLSCSALPLLCRGQQSSPRPLPCVAIVRLASPSFWPVLLRYAAAKRSALLLPAFAKRSFAIPLHCGASLSHAVAKLCSAELGYAAAKRRASLPRLCLDERHHAMPLLYITELYPAIALLNLTGLCLCSVRRCQPKPRLCRVPQCRLHYSMPSL